MGLRQRKASNALAAAVVVCAVASAGCDVDFAYLLPAAVGQVELLANIEPIDQALAEDDLTQAQRTKLELISDVRVYAGDVIGLNIADNFTTFYNSHGDAVAFNISASRKDALVPRLWRFPFVGTVPYLGYFDEAAALNKRQQLQRDDYDVFMYQIDAYSGLGVFPNPVLSPLLERDDANLVDTIIHELLHATVYRANDTPFNESLATFFGRVGAEHYYAARYPDQPELIQQARERYEDIDRFNDFMLGFVNELDAFYASDLSSEEKIAQREALFQAAGQRFQSDVLPLMNNPDGYAWVVNLPANNAYMLGIRRYNLDTEVFAGVFEATGEDWAASLAVFRQAAQQELPYDYLRTWAAEHGVSDANMASGAGTESKSVQPSGWSVPVWLDKYSQASTHPLCDRHASTTILVAE